MNRSMWQVLFFRFGRHLLGLLGALALLVGSTSAQTITFAAIGDFGEGSTAELAVANQVKSWNPDFIITLGDNNYPDGTASTIDGRIGKYYAAYISPYMGAYGPGSNVNRFFPTLGNHDWHAAGAKPYLDYFTLPGNERYYDFIRGPVHFFALDSDNDEPDGAKPGSLQYEWLERRMAASTAPWKIVYFHHAPYTSGDHDSTNRMRWPFDVWGAHAVLAAHNHNYERLLVDGIPYFVNGLGGADIYSFSTPVPESIVRYHGDHGAMKIMASESSITFQFITHTGKVIDTHTITKPSDLPGAPTGLVATLTTEDGASLSWTDNAQNDIGQEVQRSTNGTDFVRIANLGPDATQYDDVDLVFGQTYYYRVLAWNEVGVGVSQSSCLSIPAAPDRLTLFDAVLALRASAGLYVPAEHESYRLNVIGCSTEPIRIDLRDAMWIARQAYRNSSS